MGLALDAVDERDLFLLRKDLAGWRVIERHNFRDMAKKVNVSDHVLGDCERGRAGTLTFSNIQLWCKSLNMRLMYHFDGLSRPTATVGMESLDAIVAAGVGNIDPYDRMLFIELLKQMRFCLKIPRQLVADAVGIKASSLTTWEGGATDLRIDRGYNYVRALGGRLKLSAERL